MEQKQIYQSLAAIMNEVEAIGKNKKNQQQGFAYRGIDDMYNDLQPKFAKHKVFITSEVLDIQRDERTNQKGTTLFTTILKVRFSFYAEDGSCVSSITVGEAMDSGDKGANKAMSIALKYCLMQLLLIPTEEQKKDDPDGYVHQVAPKAQPVAIPTKEEKQMLIDLLENSDLNPDERIAAFKAISDCSNYKTYETIQHKLEARRKPIDQIHNPSQKQINQAVQKKVNATA
jgi:hypothetical protein